MFENYYIVYYICSNVNYNFISYNNISMNIVFYSCFDSTLSKINLFLSLRFKKIYFSRIVQFRIQFRLFSFVTLFRLPIHACMSEVDQFTDWCLVGKYEQRKIEARNFRIDVFLVKILIDLKKECNLTNLRTIFS